MSKPPNRRQPARRRSELERLLDLTVLEPTHPELGSCWRFTGTATPYGRVAKAQDSYTHRLGWSSCGVRFLRARNCIIAAGCRACAAEHQRAFHERQAAATGDR